MEYTLRNPKASDLFLMGRIISKIGVKNIIDKLYNNDNVKELIANSNGDKDGYIYVPDDMVDTLKADSRWSTYATQIKPLSELPEDEQ